MTIPKMKSLKTAVLCFCLMCSPWPGYAASVIYISASAEKTEEPLAVASAFYGLTFVPLSVKELASLPREAAERTDLQALIIAAEALPHLDAGKFGASLRKVPWLISGVNSRTNPEILNTLSNGAIKGIKRTKEIKKKRAADGSYTITGPAEISRSLNGQRFSSAFKSVNYFLSGKPQSADPIIHINENSGKTSLPVFIRTAAADKQELFFLADAGLSAQPKNARSARFFELAPFLMFLRHACGERCWHSPGHYANLTIDDPWLTGVYGHVNYAKLLKQMDKANFHTTIGFIPWNYDRNEAETVALFRDRPDRYSLCIHGNNHDHREFYKYETVAQDPWPAKPLAVQETNIRQALARMEKSRRLTGLPYERVMVFPHNIAPAQTLGLLKKYNFLATLNAGNVPLGSPAPNDPLFPLRTVTLAFANFASLDRHTPDERSSADIAVDLFLGNPLLFYEHQAFFAEGINTFNKTASLINKIQPGIRWQSPAYIARHLYLQRVRDNGGYDIRAFSKQIKLENKQKRDIRYFVRKAESFSPPLKQVYVNGKAYFHRASGGDISLNITLPAGESRLIDIVYKNDFDPASVDIAKNNARVNRLRKISDFRDMTLSTNALGLALTKAYYNTGLYKLGLKRLLIIPAAFFIILILGILYWKRLKTSRRQK
ncbi:MAG: hypothetical protein GY862_05190 [Gammaproteobacteria bacterium]|nr:hypothetical protein [Gammaproteobacteria bacterium]